ncbi:MAG: flagellar motor switch phosphatase FliY [Clostridiales bacterium]|jgi:flagellar motor switch protein FliN/FliY|nr:flagellar motor switch phosphatase FliY [Clostridiales bacterium]
MAEMLSQDEINALLGGGILSDTEGDSQVGHTSSVNDDDALTSEENDILGEIGNISMGTAATTLSAILNQRVNITTPVVNICTWEDISAQYVRPCVGVRIDYTLGLRGTNILILVNKDVKTITDLMMGGDGLVSADHLELTELDLSAIGEAMNQMIGSASTSVASMMNEKIDIATPKAFQIDFSNDDFFHDIVTGGRDENVVAISFNLQIGELIDSVIVQALPIEFAKQMAKKLKTELVGGGSAPEPVPKAAPAPAPAPMPVREAPIPPAYAPQAPAYAPQTSDPYAAYPYAAPPQPMPTRPAPPPQHVNAQPVQFESFDFESAKQQKENIDILMDVPLEVTVELGKTSKKIKDILEFAPGTIIELDKLAGEPIDILVNGKYVAKGEVVVIEENFAIRITSIISTELRI